MLLLVLACFVIIVTVTLLRYALLVNFRAVKNENIYTINEAPPPPPTVDELLNNTSNIQPKPTE